MPLALADAAAEAEAAALEAEAAAADAPTAAAPAAVAEAAVSNNQAGTRHMPLDDRIENRSNPRIPATASANCTRA